MRPLLQTKELALRSPSGRPLVDGLTMRLSAERVALVGRNGVGKSTLLAALAAGDHERIVVAGGLAFVPQLLAPAETCGRSHGEARRAALHAARASGAEVLLLDEPTEDLDDDGVAWLRHWLRRWDGCAVIATHDRRLLQDFRHFFVVSESGCHYVHGSLDELERTLDREHTMRERTYAADLHRLVVAEERATRVARRKARKKRRGRASELDRATPRIRLNAKRGQAQVSHGKIARAREARLARLRALTKSSRRHLRIELTPSLAMPTTLGESSTLVEVHTNGLDLVLGRDRLGVVGPNGAGKTTLLQTIVGNRAPMNGTAWCDSARIGVVEQGGANWMLDASLLERLAHLESPTRVLVAHRFPLALAERPLRSLSPGERARAALLCIFASAPPIEMLVLDEPTFSLDLVGQAAMTDALRAWPGGLVVATHDRAFLERIGIGTVVDLGASAARRSTSFERGIAQVELASIRA